MQKQRDYDGTVEKFLCSSEKEMTKTNTFELT